MTFGGNKRENKISTMKNGWESELGYSSSRCGRHGGERRRGPGSTMSAESDIRFTRRKLSRSCRGCCAALAAFLVFLLVAAVVVYLGHLYLFRDPLNKQIFRAAFRVLDDTWSDEAIDPASEPYLVKERDYRERLNLLFQKSELRSTYDGTEILALDSSGNDMIVHFDVYFDPIFTSVDVRDVEEILVREIELGTRSQFFGNITIDRDSFHIEESEAILNAPVTISSASNVVTTTVVPTIPPPPRECSPISLLMCKHLPYNMTSYPNAVGHASLKELEEDMIAYRELIDAECYSLAYDFVCQLLQPSCVSETDEDRLVLPCRSYCREFYAGCGNRLPERLKKKINCSKFPDYHGLTSCRPRADCTANLQSRALSPRICDGVPDCEDMTDETSCRYCTPGHVHCGLTKKCIPIYKQCDGTRDCPDGSDERSCLIMEPSLAHMRQLPSESTFPHRLYPRGFVVFNEQGNIGKVCAGSYNESEKSLNTVATSLCHSLSYRKVDTVEIKLDEEKNYNYVEIEDPFAAEIGFLKSTCPSKQVLHVGCSEFDCGKQSARPSTGIDNLGRMAQYGDWPWHAALFKEDTHVCDATLISAEWLATTASCFQGQPKAEWVARLGSVRIMSTSPWQQERRIVGMVKSPVEGSTIALIKMEEPVFMSDFVRPVCMPEMNVKNDMSVCNTLGWTRNRDHLRRIHLTVRPMDKCENVSIATVNSMCTEALYEQDDCDEEEFAGSSMVCLNTEAKRWSLAGIGNWRIACTKIGLGRPRMYDSMTSNVEWIKKTIGATL